MVLIIEGVGVLVAIFFAIGLCLVRGRKRKVQLGVCALIVLAGFAGAAVIAREGVPFITHPAPLSASAQVIFTGPTFEGRLAIESLNARDGSMRWRHLFDIREGQTAPPHQS